MLTMLIAAQASEGLTFGDMLKDIPHDGPAIVVYVLLGAFVYLIWRGNRRRPEA